MMLRHDCLLYVMNMHHRHNAVQMLVAFADGCEVLLHLRHAEYPAATIVCHDHSW